MVVLGVFSLPIMNYKTLFLQKRYCCLLNQNALLVKYYFPGREEKKKKKTEKIKYKEEIKRENKGKSLTVSSSCSNFLSF